jgi:hypothetical protein
MPNEQIDLFPPLPEKPTYEATVDLGQLQGYHNEPSIKFPSDPNARRSAVHIDGGGGVGSALDGEVTFMSTNPTADPYVPPRLGAMGHDGTPIKNDGQVRHEQGLAIRMHEAAIDVHTPPLSDETREANKAHVAALIAQLHNMPQK